MAIGCGSIGSDGSWWIYSQKDPRWNISGSGYVGSGAIPDEAWRRLAELDKHLGKRPDDLQWGYMKD